MKSTGNKKYLNLIVLLFIFIFTFVSRYVGMGFQILEGQVMDKVQPALLLLVLPVLHFLGMFLSAGLFSKFNDLAKALLISSVGVAILSLLSIVLPSTYGVLSFSMMVFFLVRLFHFLGHIWLV